MNNLLKDIAVLLFSVGDEIEQKADDFKDKRKERFDKMEYDLKEKKDEYVSKFGLATKKQIDELTKQLDNLSSKLDKIIK
ncbi:MAG: hypothetical protein GY870_13155 [archaeon]|nr:hypothetical protein [archaeon]